MRRRAGLAAAATAPLPPLSCSEPNVMIAGVANGVARAPARAPRRRPCAPPRSRRRRASGRAEPAAQLGGDERPDRAGHRAGVELVVVAAAAEVPGGFGQQPRVAGRPVQLERGEREVVGEDVVGIEVLDVLVAELRDRVRRLPASYHSRAAVR